MKIAKIHNSKGTFTNYVKIVKLRKMKKNESKKYILAAPGFEPTTLSDDNFAQNRNIYECPLATSGNVSSVQLAQSAPF